MASPSNVALQAAIDGNLGLLQMMASKVNLREAKDDKGRNALHLAAEKGHLEVCRFLVEESGLDVDSVSVEGRRPVHGAAAGGSESVLRYLLDRGGDLVMPDSKGSTPLHDAAEGGHCEAVKLLLSKGITDVDAIGLPLHLNKRSPLHLAASKGKDQVLKILLDHGADPNKVVRQFFTPLLVACLGGSLKCMKLLVEAGADVNFISPRGPVVLMEAVNRGLTGIVKFLLEAGADPNIPDKDGRILIIWAAAQGKREIVELLFPKTVPVRYLPDWSVDGIIRSVKLLCFHAKVSTCPEEDIEMKEFVQGRCNGTFAKIFHLFCEIDVVGSKRKGLKILCQAYRYVIDTIRVRKKSWGGKFAACNLRVTGGRFRIDLAPLLPATAEHIWADLMGITTCMTAYFVLGPKRPIYVRHLFELCKKLHKGVARGMHEPGALDRYLSFIYNHPSFGFSIERGDLIRGIGMALKFSSTDDINALVSCMSKGLGPPSELGDWRAKVIDVAVLKDVFFASVNMDSASVDKQIIDLTHFQPKPEDNFIFCRHALEHGPERTLIKTGGGKYEMLCPMCKHNLKSKYQRDLVSKAILKAASVPGSPIKWGWNPKKILTESDTSVFQIQPLQCPGEIELLVGEIFDGFISDSICEILLEPSLDTNTFVQARLEVFIRSICEELNGEGEEKDENEGHSVLSPGLGSSSSAQDNGGP